MTTPAPLLGLRALAARTTTTTTTGQLSHCRSLSTSPVRAIRPQYHHHHRQQRRRPWTVWRTRFDRLTPGYVLYSLIGANVAVFGLWQLGWASATDPAVRDASLYRAMQRNFTLSVDNLKSGRIWTLLTPSFSHEMTGHIVLNMASLYFLGAPVLGLLGPTAFCGLYLASGVACSLSSLVFHRVFGRREHWASHGASGAVYGTMAFLAAAQPHARFLVFFVVPVPAWLCVAGLFTWDVANSFTPGQRAGGTDNAGHVGGILGGLLYFARLAGRI